MRKRWFWAWETIDEGGPYVMVYLGLFWLDYRPRNWWPDENRRWHWGGWNRD